MPPSSPSCDLVSTAKLSQLSLFHLSPSTSQLISFTSFSPSSLSSLFSLDHSSITHKFFSTPNQRTQQSHRYHPTPIHHSHPRHLTFLPHLTSLPPNNLHLLNMSSSPLSTRRSSRARRAPPVFGNTVSSDQLYGRDDEGDAPAKIASSQESGGWGGEGGDDDEGEESLESLEGSLEDDVSPACSFMRSWSRLWLPSFLGLRRSPPRG